MPVGCVYFVHSPDHKLIKIGVTKSHPDIRFRSLVNSSPAPLVKLGVVGGGWAQERRLHARFRPMCSHAEWFWENDALWGYVRRYVKPWPAPWECVPEPDRREREEVIDEYRHEVIAEHRLARREFYDYLLSRSDCHGMVGLS